MQSEMTIKWNETIRDSWATQLAKSSQNLKKINPVELILEVSRQ